MSNLSDFRAKDITSVIEGNTFYDGDVLITENHTVPDGRNSMTPGPITLEAGVTVTVSGTATWTVV